VAVGAATIGFALQLSLRPEGSTVVSPPSPSTGSNTAAPAAPGSLTPAQQSVLAYLDSASELAGQWREINEDPLFIAWLEQRSSSGQTWLLLLRDAYAKGDGKRAAAFYRAYLNRSPASQQPVLLKEITRPAAIPGFAPR
jgi:hypothetical protein